MIVDSVFDFEDPITATEFTMIETSNTLDYNAVEVRLVCLALVAKRSDNYQY